MICFEDLYFWNLKVMTFTDLHYMDTRGQRFQLKIFFTVEEKSHLHLQRPEGKCSFLGEQSCYTCTPGCTYTGWQEFHHNRVYPDIVTMPIMYVQLIHVLWIVYCTTCQPCQHRMRLRVFYSQNNETRTTKTIEARKNTDLFCEWVRGFKDVCH